MSHKRFSVSEWSLRRKLALALAIPMVLAAVFGGLRVYTERVEAANYTATASQVTVLRPAVAYLAAAERAAVIAREADLDDPEREAAIKGVDFAGSALERARDAADLTPTQLTQVNSLLDLSSQLRDGRAYVSLSSTVSQVRKLHAGVTQLLTTIVNEQIQPEPRLRVLEQAVEGRLSLAMQQIQVAYNDGADANPVELAAEVGVEAAAIERLRIALEDTEPLVLNLRQDNSLRFGTVREGGTDLGGQEAYDSYDTVTGNLLTGIDESLSSAAASSRTLVIVNAAITLGALLAAILLALMISRLLLRPIRKVRDGALEVARERLPEVVARIRAGEEPGEIVPIEVTTHEDIGQLARAVDDLHRQAVFLASGEAQLRSQVGEMFVTLSRRNTSLINQQLGLIESLERNEEDPQRLESLFRLDHLASRMRRTADSLMVLADAPTRSSIQDGLSVADSLHAANAGVQDYQRVQILSTPVERIRGVAAQDVVHLLTELVDNALSYSPPTTPVLVMTSSSVHGTVISISDAGLGIAEDELPALNADLVSGGEVTSDATRRMGLLVVSRLARRHGISVVLAANERGGTTATVNLPGSILLRANGPEPTDDTDGTDRTVSAEEAVAAATLVGPVLVAAPALSPDAETDDDDGEDDAADGPDVPVPAAVALVAVPDVPAALVRVPPGPEASTDAITDAINAVIRLPQRAPGSSGAGTPLTPSPGPALLPPRPPVEGAADDEDEPSREPAYAAAELPEPAFPEPVFLESGYVEPADEPADEDDDHADEPVDDHEDEDHADYSDLFDYSAGIDVHEDEDADEDHSEAPVDEPAAEHEDEDFSDEPVDEHDDEDDSEADDDVEAEDHADEADETDQDEDHADEPAAEHEVEDEHEDEDDEDDDDQLVDVEAFPAAAHRPSDQPRFGAVASPSTALGSGLGVLDRETVVPDTSRDETPIFLAMRSNWLSADGSTEKPWTSTEVEAGWDAADRVSTTPTAPLTDAGLPMRRPGNRLVPGGVSSIPQTGTATIARDPEAIRARLAAHSAGVNRGRSVAGRPDHAHATSPSPTPGPQKEADSV